MRTQRKFIIVLSLLTLVLAVAAVGSAAEKYIIDLANPEHVALIESPFSNWPVSIEPDPFGDLALLFPQGNSSMAPPADVYQSMRYVTLDIPDVREFSLSVEQLGVGGEKPPKANPNVSGGNRSLALVFGYEDPKNWWVVYYTYTNTTSIRRYVDGEQIYVCRPMDLEQWMPDNFNYQKAEVRLTQEGDQMVLRVYANGEPISIDGCTFPAADYRGGKVGFGGHSTSDLQSWYLKNIELEVLD